MSQTEIKQCPEFRQAITEDDRILAAAIRDPFWGTCLSMDTMSAKPDSIQERT